MISSFGSPSPGLPFQHRQQRVEVRERSSAFTRVRENLGVTLVPEMTLAAGRQGLRVIALQPRIERVFSRVLASE